jgi:hypothetical protein
MMRALLPVFQWFSITWAGLFIQRSTWIFPAIEAIHIVALTVLFGAILLIDLQMLGLVRRDTSAAKLARDLDPWAFSSLVLILASGVLLFSSEAMKLYNNTPFQLKMTLLITALVYNFTIHRWVTNSHSGRIGPLWTRLTAIISISLWLGVGLAGRAIGFF